jgi:hypothetical protein
VNRELTILFFTRSDFGNVPENTKVYRTSLGLIGRGSLDVKAKAQDDKLAQYIKVIQQLADDDRLKPNEYILVGETGFESFIEGTELLASGKNGTNKIVVKVQDE